jgi:hypothetical protein
VKVALKWENDNGKEFSAEVDLAEAPAIGDQIDAFLHRPIRVQRENTGWVRWAVSQRVWPSLVFRGDPVLLVLVKPTEPVEYHREKIPQPLERV